MKTTHLRINPVYPLCWEDTETLRFGFDEAQFRLHAPSPAVQRFIGKLCDGVKENELASLGARCELDPAEQRKLMQELDHLLVRYSLPADEVVPTTTQNFRVVVLGSGTIAESVRRALARAGLDAAGSPDAASFAILIERFFGAASRAWPLHSEGVPHYPISLSDTALSAGPLVLPEDSPCLSCVELHRLDAQPHLAVLAAQIVGRRPAAENTVCAELAGALAVAAASFCIARASEGQGSASPRPVSQPTPPPTQWSAPEPLPHTAATEAATRLRFALRRGILSLTPEIERVTPHPECGCVTLAQSRTSSLRAA